MRADCAYSHSGEGLHRFVDPVDGRIYLYTQFEVPDARRVFTTFEQPDLKSVFTWTVVAPSDWKVVSNAPTPEPEELDGDRARWSFPESKRMSTYITALIAGEYHEHQDVYEGPHGPIPLGHYCRQSIVDHLDVDELLTITKQGFEFFEDAFDFPYPFQKYDQLYVPEYNAGAMENAGAVTIRDEYLPRSRQDGAFYEFRASCILHEMAHMWFGDLVTMKWWDDLWLNESFAEWACYHAAVQNTAFPRRGPASPTPGRTGRCARTSCPRPTRSRPTTTTCTRSRPTSTASPTPRARPCSSSWWPGSASSRSWWACGSTSRTTPSRTPSSSTCSRRWRSPRAASSTPGPRSGCRPAASTPSPRSSSSPTTAATRRSASSQTAADDYPQLRRHRLGIGLYDEQGGRLVRRRYLEVDVEGEITDVPGLVGEQQPDLLLLNDGDLTYAKIRLDERSLATVVDGLRLLDDSLARALCWGAAWDMTRDAEMAASDYVRLVLRNIGSETDSFGIRAIPAYASLAVNFYSDPARRDALRREWEDGLRALLHAAEPGSNAQLIFARAYGAARGLRRGGRPRCAACSTARPRSTGSMIDTDLRWALVTGLAKAGAADDALIDAELERDPTIAGQEHAAAARASRPDAAAKSAAWSDLVDNPEIPNGTYSAIAAAFMRHGQQELLEPYLEQYLEAADDIWERLGTHMASNFLEGAFPPAARQRGDGRPAGPLARGVAGQPRGQALRPRGPGRPDPRPGDAGQGRPGLTPSRRRATERAESARDDSAWVRCRRGGCAGRGRPARACSGRA